MACESVKYPLTVICGSAGGPWTLKVEPRSPSDVCGVLRRPPKLRV